MDILTCVATPALLLERAIVERNTGAMRERMQRHGVRLRPHLKTAKSARVAALATEGEGGPITVSTLREAEYFLEHGYADILLAVGIAPEKLGRVHALQQRGARMSLITDNRTMAEGFAAHTRSASVPLSVLIEVDTGGARAGVLPGGEELLALAHSIARAPGLELGGVLTHAGHSYHRQGEAVRVVAREERDGVVLAATRLREAGLPCPVVSAGSTPTAVYSDDMSGLSEMRPGVYVFFDLTQLAIGACEREDIALSVLASVIGHNRHAGHLLIDAGALALSKDVGANEHRPELGYGEVCHPETLAPFAGLFVARVHQEHGIVPVPDPRWFDWLAIGARVRVLPNHACLTAAAYDRYLVVEHGTVVDEWDRINGW